MNGKHQMQFDMLNEITKVAAIKATSALSKILEFPIGVDISPVEKTKLPDLQKLMEPDENIVALNVPIVGSLSGTCLLIYPEDAAFSICDAMFHRKEGQTKLFTEVEISALTEAANIVVGNFLTSFAAPLRVDPLMHRNADFTHNEYAPFIDKMANTFSKHRKNGLIVEIVFHFQNIKIKGMAIFLFNENEMSAALKRVNS